MFCDREDPGQNDFAHDQTPAFHRPGDGDHVRRLDGRARHGVPLRIDKGRVFAIGTRDWRAIC